MNVVLESSSSVRQLSLLSADLLAVRTEKSLQMYRLPEVTKSDLVLPQSAFDTMSAEERYRRRNGYYGRDQEPDLLQMKRLKEGWYLNGCLLTPDGKSVRMPVAVSSLPLLPVDAKADDPTPILWGRSITSEALKTTGDQTICAIDGDETVLLRDLPIAAILDVDTTDDYSMETVSAHLELRDLVDGLVIERVSLVQNLRATREGSRRRSAGLALPTSTGRTILAVFGKKIYFLTLSDELVAKVKSPFQIEPLEAVKTLSVEKSLTIEHKIRGGVAPFEYALVTNRRGVSIDPKTGTVSINGPELKADAIEVILQRLSGQSNEDRYYGGYREEVTDPTELIQKLDALIVESGKPFKTLTGRELEGVALLLPVGVKGADAGQQAATLNYQVLVELPKAVVLEAIKKKWGAQLATRKKEAANQGRQSKERAAKLEQWRATANKAGSGKKMPAKGAAPATRVDSLIVTLGSSMNQLMMAVWGLVAAVVLASVILALSLRRRQKKDAA